MRVSQFTPLFLAALIIGSSAEASGELTLVCKGILEESARDTRPRFEGYSRSKPTILTIKVREEKTISPPKSIEQPTKDWLEKMFPGGLRSGTVTIVSGISGSWFGSTYRECDITDERMTCSYKIRREEDGIFASYNNRPEMKLPELPPGNSSGLPPELKSRGSVEIKIDRRTGLLEFASTYEAWMAIATPQSGPFVSKIDSKGSFLCERASEKTRF